MTSKKVLGRGLDALIPKPASSPAKTPTTTEGVQSLAVSILRPNPRQPRTRFAKEEIAELAASIREHGILQPLIIRVASNGEHQVVAGERRLLAAREAGLAAVPCIVREIPDDLLLPLALVENLQREDLNAVEEARAYHQLTKDFGLSHDAVARAVGKSRVAVTNALRLLDLPKTVLEMIEAGDLSAGQARPLIGVTPATKQTAWARRIVRQSLSARKVEALVNAGQSSRKKNVKTPEAEPYFEAVVRRLENRVATKVRITGTPRRGVVEVYYFSADDLERILDIIAPSPRH